MHIIKNAEEQEGIGPWHQYVCCSINTLITIFRNFLLMIVLIYYYYCF
jgi:hypothetical protein